jgi:hypothetical protein
MADKKYGEMYTEDELVQVVQMAVESAVGFVSNGESSDEVIERFSDADIREVARTDIKRKFHPGEPIFILRGQDKRALGAVRFYREHQWPSATQEHLDNIDDAVADFEAYRNLGHMKEPD